MSSFRNGTGELYDGVVELHDDTTQLSDETVKMPDTIQSEIDDMLDQYTGSEQIQAKKNRQEDVLLPEIEELLDAEFAAYQVKLNEQIEKMNAALERNRSKRLSEEETRELKKLYRATVKLLHPDINPDLSEEKINLFHNAVTAYKNGDIDGLRIISILVTGSTLPVVKADPASLLVKERARLSKLLQSVREGIKKIKSEYPYNMKNFVQSPEEVEKRRAQLESRIEQLNERLADYKAKIGEMLG